MASRQAAILNNIIFLFYTLYVFCSTFSIGFAQVSLGMALIGFILMMIVTGYNPFVTNLRWFYLAVGGYLAWSILSALINDTPIQSLLILKEEWLFLAVPVGVFLLQQKLYRRALMMALAVGVFIISIYSFVQHFTGVHWFKDMILAQAQDKTYFATGGFNHNLTFGNYFVVAATFLAGFALLHARKLSCKVHILTMVAGAAGLVAVLLSYSRTAVASIPFVLLFLAYLKGRRWIIGTLLLLVIAAPAAFFGIEELAFKFDKILLQDLTGKQQSSRFFIWERSLDVVLDNPVFGVGQGNFEKAYKERLDFAAGEHKVRAHAHNDILNTAAVSGIPGAIVFILMWIALFRHLRQIWKNREFNLETRIFAGASAAGAIAFLLTSVTEASFADEEVRQLLMFIWAVGLWPLSRALPGVNTGLRETT